ncbi:MAG: quinolinate synthase NadA [Spirochaetes bacterium]|nr:quinolinate synthase NadA [Spirochaetota bacterium]
MDATIKQRIKELKLQRNAMIVAHNYQLPEIQDLADFTGDSLELSVKAASIDCQVLVFCGVRFMAETAKILSPAKTVLFPVLEAGCPMADMITREELIAFKQDHPGAIVVCYVNSSAEVKAECDIAVTSANAARIVSQLPPEREIIFLPDRHLGAYVQAKTGRQMVLWPGYCPTHARITPQEIRALRNRYPNAVVLVHPECPSDTIEEADEVLSTGGMCTFVRTSTSKQFIIATESGIIHRLKKENPNAEYIPVSPYAICPNMKQIHVEDVLRALEKMEYPIQLSEEIRERALLPLRRMLDGRIE